MATRNTKVLEQLKTKTTRAKTRVAEAVEQVVPHEEQSAYDQMNERIQAALNDYFIATGQPSWKMQIAGIVAGLISAAAVTYYGMSLVNMLTVAVAMTSGPGFLSFLVAFVGIIVVLFGGMTAYSVVSDKVSRINVDAVKSKFAGWFGRNEQVSAA